MRKQVARGYLMMRERLSYRIIVIKLLAAAMKPDQSERKCCFSLFEINVKALKYIMIADAILGGLFFLNFIVAFGYLVDGSEGNL